jgi:ketosteroid isomerase-like protein
MSISGPVRDYSGREVTPGRRKGGQPSAGSLPLSTRSLWRDVTQGAREMATRRVRHAERARRSSRRLTDAGVIRDVVERWALAVRSKNLPGVVAHHSADMLMFDVTPPIQWRGRQAYRRTWGPFFSWLHDSGLFDLRELRITAGQDVAFATALIRCGGREADGRSIRLDVRLTLGLRKRRGQWTIAHEHHSVPAE